MTDFYNPVATPWNSGAFPSANFMGGTNYGASLAATPAIGAAIDSVGTGTTSGAPAWSDDFWGSILGKTAADGSKTGSLGSLGLGAASGIMNAWMGMQQLGVAKDTLAANKEQFAKNYAAQQKTTNAQLSDRQAARVASNPTAYQSVGDYMKQNGI